MGNKVVCLDCRKAFSERTDNLNVSKRCPDCGNSYVSYPHRFRPPKMNDLNAWKVVIFLYDHGFIYQHIQSDKSNFKNDDYAEYPTNIIAARGFVEQYKAQAKHLPSRK